MSRKVINIEEVKSGIMQYAGKLNMKEISKRINVSHSTVFKYASKLGIDMTAPDNRHKMRKRNVKSNDELLFNESKRSNWLV